MEQLECEEAMIVSAASRYVESRGVFLGGKTCNILCGEYPKIVRKSPAYSDISPILHEVTWEKYKIRHISETIYRLYLTNCPPEGMEEASRLLPSILKLYQCLSLSKAKKLAFKILFFAHSLISFEKIYM